MLHVLGLSQSRLQIAQGLLGLLGLLGLPAESA
jgi:hypothetical protein